MNACAETAGELKTSCVPLDSDEGILQPVLSYTHPPPALAKLATPNTIADQTISVCLDGHMACRGDASVCTRVPDAIS